MPITPAAHTEIIRRLADRLRASYVFPAVAEQVAARITQQHAESAYADIDEGEFFAYALTTHMQEVAHDEHLWVRYHAEPLPDDDRQLRENAAWQAARREEARQANYGLQRVEWLPGNIGLLAVRRFHRAEWGAATAAAALTFLADTAALIVDLRECEGGSPDMVTLISSYLFADQPLHLSSIYWRDEDRTQEFWTRADLPGRRYGAAKPVAVLVSAATFSAGEAFAYDLQAQGRVTVIGEVTGGGANPGASYRLHPHMEAFIPVGRAINPVTGGNWEGVGVTPDLRVPAAEALGAALTILRDAAR